MRFIHWSIIICGCVCVAPTEQTSNMTNIRPPPPSEPKIFYDFLFYYYSLIEFNDNVYMDLDFEPIDHVRLANMAEMCSHEDKRKINLWFRSYFSVMTSPYYDAWYSVDIDFCPTELLTISINICSVFRGIFISFCLKFFGWVLGKLHISSVLFQWWYYSFVPRMDFRD